MLTQRIDVSQEARDVGLHNYKPFFGTHFNRGLGGGPLYLSENPRIYVNWKSDIICPILGSWPRGIAVNDWRLVIEFVLGFLSRLPFFRIAISLNTIHYFEEKFAHELAWSQQQKEVIVFAMGPRSFLEQRFQSSRQVVPRFRCVEHEDREYDSYEIGRLNLEVESLRKKVTENRERCPALAGPFPPLSEAVMIEF